MNDLQSVRRRQWLASKAADPLMLGGLSTAILVIISSVPWM